MKGPYSIHAYMYMYSSFVTGSEVVAQDLTESPDEECSRSSSVRRPRTVGHMVEGVGSSGHRKERKRRRQQKTALPSPPLSSGSHNEEGPSLSSRDTQEQATHVLEHGTSGLGSESRDIHIQAPSSTHHGANNTDVLHTNIPPHPAQEMSITKATSPVPLTSSTSQY